MESGENNCTRVIVIFLIILSGIIFLGISAKLTTGLPYHTNYFNIGTNVDDWVADNFNFFYDFTKQEGEIFFYFTNEKLNIQAFHITMPSSIKIVDVLVNSSESCLNMFPPVPRSNFEYEQYICRYRN